MNGMIMGRMQWRYNSSNSAFFSAWFRCKILRFDISFALNFAS